MNTPTLLLPTGPSHKMLSDRPFKPQTIILPFCSLKFFYGSICIVTQCKLCNLAPSDSALPVSISSTGYSLGSTNINLFLFSWTSYAFPNTRSCHKIVPFFEILSSPSFVKITYTHLLHCGLYCKKASSLAIRSKSEIFWKSLKIIWKLNK